MYTWKGRKSWNGLLIKFYLEYSIMFLCKNNYLSSTDTLLSSVKKQTQTFLSKACSAEWAFMWAYSPLMSLAHTTNITLMFKTNDCVAKCYIFRIVHLFIVLIHHHIKFFILGLSELETNFWNIQNYMLGSSFVCFKW